MRAITHTTISYGLQNIPVSVCTLVRDSGVHTSFSCPKCDGDIGLKNYCKNCNSEFTKQDELNKAYKLSKDKKIPIDKDRLKAIYEKENTINILYKLPRSAIDVSLINGSYYLLPHKLTKQWSIIQRGLTQSNNVMVCTFSIRGKTRLGIITTKGNVIVLLSLAFNEQIVKLEEDYGTEITEEEVKLGKDFVDNLPDGSIEKIKDGFKERFEKLLTSNDPVEIPKVEQPKEDDLSFFKPIEVKK